MSNLHINRNVFDAVQRATQNELQGSPPLIDDLELKAIEEAIIEDGDISTDEESLLSHLKYRERFTMVTDTTSAEIDPLNVVFPSATAFSDIRALEHQALQRTTAVTNAETMSSEQQLADIQTSFDGATEALQADDPERAAQILTESAAAIRRNATGFPQSEATLLRELARNMDLRARAYRQEEPDSAISAAGSLQRSAHNLNMIAERLATTQPGYSEFLRQVAADTVFQSGLLAQSAANTKSTLGLAVSNTYRSIVTASFEQRIANTGPVNNFFTGSREQLIRDQARMTEAFDYIDQRMQTEGRYFHEVWHDMFRDSTMASQTDLPHFVTAKDAAMFLRDHAVSRGLLIPMTDLSRGLAAGDAEQAELARGQLVMALRENDQWELARQVLDNYREIATTSAGQTDANRLDDNESGQWWRAKTLQFAREDLPVLILSGIVSGGVGAVAGTAARGLGMGVSAARATQLSAEIATFVPAERLLNDAINGRNPDWSGGALARDYALTIGGYGLAKALGAGWRSLRGQSTITPASQTTLRPGPQTQHVNPDNVRFSQNTVSYNRTDRATGQSFTYDDLVENMRRNGWQGDPVDVVLLDDALSSIDNTRILAAREASIQAQVRVRAFDDVLTPLEQQRFRLRGKPTPTTWGEAITLRIQNQTGRFGELFPAGSLYAPRITGRPQ